MPTYAELFLAAAERAPQRDALVFPGTRVTYSDLRQRGEGRGRQLQALGVQRGGRFGLLMQNCPEIVEFLLGAAFIGACAVPINTRFKPYELAHVIADAELTAMVTTGGVAGVLDFIGLLHETIPEIAEQSDPLALALPLFPELRTVATTAHTDTRGLVATAGLSTDAIEVHGERRGEDPLLIMYTSGTTANPKGCVLTSQGVAMNAAAIVDRLQVPEGETWWDPLPMFHMGGIMLMSTVFAAAGTFISQAYFTPDEALDLITAERPGVLYPLFPTISLDLIHHPRFARSNISGVRLISSVAPPDVQQRIQSALPDAKLFSAYGITELCGCVAFHSPDDPPERRLASCGTELRGFEMRIVDPDANVPLPAGERGELVGRGPQMFTGYYGNPEATAAVVDSEGFFHTGDLCSMDEHGDITYHGRIKDMLKVGGENVSAIEVESYLATHPAIKMAQVIGVPDPRLLEVGAAFVELTGEQTLTEDEVIAYCQGKIARFKVPRYVRFVEEWPMSATKVQKFRLRDQLIAELAAAEPAAR